MTTQSKGSLYVAFVGVLKKIAKENIDDAKKWCYNDLQPIFEEAWTDLLNEWKEKDGELAALYDILNKPLKECELSIRATSALEWAGIRTVKQLVRYKRGDLLRFRNFGKKSLTELDEFLKANELDWGMEID